MNELLLRFPSSVRQPITKWNRDTRARPSATECSERPADRKIHAEMVLGETRAISADENRTSVSDGERHCRKPRKSFGMSPVLSVWQRNARKALNQLCGTSHTIPSSFINIIAQLAKRPRKNLTVTQSAFDVSLGSCTLPNMSSMLWISAKRLVKKKSSKSTRKIQIRVKNKECWNQEQLTKKGKSCRKEAYENLPQTRHGIYRSRKKIVKKKFSCHTSAATSSSSAWQFHDAVKKKKNTDRRGEKKDGIRK